MSSAVGGFVLCLALLLLAAAGHKAHVLWTASALEDPIVRTFARSDGAAAAAVILGGLAEVVAALSLLVAPAVGLAVSLALIVLYTRQVLSLGATEDCNCFGRLAKAGSRQAAVIRNLALISVAAVSLALVVSGLVTARPFGPGSLGVAAISGAAVAGLLIIQSLGKAPEPEVAEGSARW